MGTSGGLCLLLACMFTNNRYRLRHALDFRLMSQARVVILDASNTLFPVEAKSASRPSPSIRDSELVLQPIPDFRSLVIEACREVVSTVARTKIAPVDIGVICDSSAVRAVARALHERVNRKLKEVKVKQEPV